MATTTIIEKLKEKKYNVKEWLVEDVIRLFGITCCFRDYPSRNKKQIYKLLKEDDNRRNAEIERDLNPVYPKIVPDSQLKRIYEKTKKECTKHLWEYLAQKEKALLCRDELDWIIEKNNSNDELVVNLFRVAKEQLDILMTDINDNINWTKMRLKGRYNSFEDYKKYIEKEQQEEIQYLEKEKEAAKKKEQYNNAEIYKNLVNLIFGKERI